MHEKKNRKSIILCMVGMYGTVANIGKLFEAQNMLKSNQLDS
jgi:hypothetical protein